MSSVFSLIPLGGAGDWAWLFAAWRKKMSSSITDLPDLDQLDPKADGQNDPILIRSLTSLEDYSR